LAYLRIVDKELLDVLNKAKAELFGEKETASASSTVKTVDEESSVTIEKKLQSYLLSDEEDEDAEMQQEPKAEAKTALKDAKLGESKDAKPDDGKGSKANEDDAPKPPRLLSKLVPQAVDASGNEYQAVVGHDLEKGMRPLKPEEIKKLLHEGWMKLPKVRTRMLGLCTALASWGCRISGALALRVGDVYHVASGTFYKQVVIHDKVRSICIV